MTMPLCFSISLWMGKPSHVSAKLSMLEWLSCAAYVFFFVSGGALLVIF